MQIRAREGRAQAIEDCGGAIEPERPAAVDGGAKVPQEGNAGRARINVRAHLRAGAWLNAPVKVLRKIREQLAADGGWMGWRPHGFVRPALRGLLCLACSVQAPADLFAYAQPGAMQAHAHSARLEVKDLRHLFRAQVFHVVKHKHDAQLRRNAQHRLA